MKPEKFHDYLRDEYFMLMNNYEDFDRRTLSIKGWVSTGAVAALALSFNSGIPRELAWVVPVFVIVLSATFWGLEASWKVFQSAIQDRIRTIEAYFRGDTSIRLQGAWHGEDAPKTIRPFQAFNAWNRSLAEDLPLYTCEARGKDERLSIFHPTRRPRPLWFKLLWAAIQGNVFLPYLVIVILSAGSLIYFVQRPAEAGGEGVATVTMRVEN